MADAFIMPSSCHRQYKKHCSILVPTKKKNSDQIDLTLQETGVITEKQLSDSGSESDRNDNWQLIGSN